jgi:hypothetical protein
MASMGERSVRRSCPSPGVLMLPQSSVSRPRRSSTGKQDRQKRDCDVVLKRRRTCAQREHDPGSRRTRDRTRSVTELEHAGYADVWPRVEHEDRQWSKHLGTYRSWYLALSNVGNAPARDVRVRTEPINEGENAWEPTTEAAVGSPDVEVLGPDGEIRFPVGATLANSAQVRCIVTWTDGRGEQTNTATLRLA